MSAAAVVWCGEICDDIALVSPVVLAHDKFEGAAEFIKVVGVFKLL